MLTISQHTQERKGKEMQVPFNTLEGINLVDLRVTVNHYTICVQKDEQTFFLIQEPTLVRSILTETHYQAFEKKLRQTSVEFTAHFCPPGHFQDQRAWVIELSLDLGHNFPGTTIELLDFGHSYGRVRINGDVNVDISHSGGVTEAGIYTDSTTGFLLYGHNKIAALNSIIAQQPKR